MLPLLYSPTGAPYDLKAVCLHFFNHANAHPTFRPPMSGHEHPLCPATTLMQPIVPKIQASCWDPSCTTLPLPPPPHSYTQHPHSIYWVLRPVGTLDENEWYYNNDTLCRQLHIP